MNYKSLEKVPPEPDIVYFAKGLEEVDQRLQAKQTEVLQRYVSYVDGVIDRMGSIRRFICEFLCPFELYTYQSAKRELEKR